MKRHKYKFYKELSKKTQLVEQRHLALNFLKSQKLCISLSTFSQRMMLFYFNSRSRTILYCLVTGRVRSTLSITNTSRHVFF